MISKPDSNQATDGSLGGKIKDVLRKWLRNDVDDMLPAVVVSYNSVTNRAVIRPLVMIGTTEGDKIPRAAVQNVPVYRYGGGGFFISFPLQPGNFGWLKANDRDISLIMQAKGGEDWPNTERLHSFSDAMFFPDTVKDWSITDAGAVFQSLDGSSVVAVNNASVEVRKGGSTVSVTEAAITLTAGGQTLSLSAGGLTHNGVNIGATHRHTGVTTGASFTGNPT